MTKIRFLSGMLLGAGTVTGLMLIQNGPNYLIVALLLATVIIAAAICD